jgi:hypothetical protein
LADTTIVLDTSCLVDFVEEGAQRDAVVALIRATVALGGKVVVADHTLDEWDRLWIGASQEAAAVDVSETALPAGTETLTSNPFIQSWIRRRAARGTKYSWSRFERDCKDPRTDLSALGAVIRPSGNHHPEDRALADRLRSEMTKANEASRRIRKRAAIDADVESAVMIARWRARGEQAFFVAFDRLTERSWRVVLPDQGTTLTVTPPAWAIFAASLMTDDPAESVQLARLAGVAAVREGFLGISSGFTFEEAVKLSQILCEDHCIPSESIHDVVQENLLDLMKETSERSHRATVDQIGALALQRRAGRRNQRAKREVQLSERRISAAQQRAEADARQRILTAEQDADSRVASAQHVAVDAQLRARRMARLAVTIPLVTALAAFVIVAAVAGWLSGGSLVVAALFGVVTAFTGVEYVRLLDRSAWSFVSSIAIAAAWAIIGSRIS